MFTGMVDSQKRVVCFLAGMMLLGLCAQAHADPKPLSKEEQAKVDRAIDRGVAFLKGAQTAKGDWKTNFEDNQVGQCALPAYALLESGLSADDPVIQKAAEYLRPKIAACHATYDLSLAILFFDRLADPKDEKLIRTCALRLIAGQHRTGGWSYLCPIPSDKNEEDLLKSLSELHLRMKKKGIGRGEALQGLDVPQVLQVLTVFQGAKDLPWMEPEGRRGIEAFATNSRKISLEGLTDNSNTQFAMLGLWKAQRHAILAKATFEIMVERFERSQSPINGFWSYLFDMEADRMFVNSNMAAFKRSMTCVGLMGLAIGRGLELKTPKSSRNIQKDIHILKGLVALSKIIGRPTNQMSKKVKCPELYYLWSLERVAMLYNLQTIGGKDWYRWGAECLVTNQSEDGGWPEPPPSQLVDKTMKYGPVINTSFALLFLKRSHPMKELTPKLPFTARDLNQAISRFLPGTKYPFQPIAPSNPSRYSEKKSKRPGP